MKEKTGPQPVQASGEFLDELKRLRRHGRMGMLERDHWNVNFLRYSPRLWTKRELKNRIAWLQLQRGKLIAKGESLKDNDRKIAKYTRELFRRESVRNQAKERDERNGKRRRKRVAVKRKRIKMLTDQWLTESKAVRNLLK